MAKSPVFRSLIVTDGGTVVAEPQNGETQSLGLAAVERTRNGCVPIKQIALCS